MSNYTLSLLTAQTYHICHPTLSPPSYKHSNVFSFCVGTKMNEITIQQSLLILVKIKCEITLPHFSMTYHRCPTTLPPPFKNGFNGFPFFWHVNERNYEPTITNNISVMLKCGMTTHCTITYHMCPTTLPPPSCKRYNSL